MPKPVNKFTSFLNGILGNQKDGTCYSQTKKAISTLLNNWHLFKSIPPDDVTLREFRALVPFRNDVWQISKQLMQDIRANHNCIANCTVVSAHLRMGDYDQVRSLLTS